MRVINLAKMGSIKISLYLCANVLTECTPFRIDLCLISSKNCKSQIYLLSLPVCSIGSCTLEVTGAIVLNSCSLSPRIVDISNSLRPRFLCDFLHFL